MLNREVVKPAHDNLGVEAGGTGKRYCVTKKERFEKFD